MKTKRVRIDTAPAKYSVILSDPPWRNSAGAGARGAADKHYPTMSLQELVDLRRLVDRFAFDNCAMFMWATCPMLPEAFQLMKAWGFDYKTIGFAWVKLNRNNLYPVTGLGRYTRSNVELCLLGTRGKLPRTSAAVGQIIYDYKRKHSQKPPEQYIRAEELYGGQKYLEMFARTQAPNGWDVWGNEV